MKKILGAILVILIVAMGFSATPASARTLEVVAFDKAKIAVENVQSMSVSVGGGYGGVSVEVSATFNSNHGFAFGAALAGIYDAYTHKYTGFGRDYDYAEKDYDTWGPIDFTKIYYKHEFGWTKGIEMRKTSSGWYYISTSFRLKVTRVTEKLIGSDSSEVVAYYSNYELVGLVAPYSMT